MLHTLYTYTYIFYLDTLAIDNGLQRALAVVLDPSILQNGIKIYLIFVRKSKT